MGGVTVTAQVFARIDLPTVTDLEVLEPHGSW